MTIVVFRHIKDKGDHDSSIVKEGIDGFLRVAKKVYHKYGPPEIIIVSPYLRTRQSAKILRKYCPNCKVLIDTRISKYFPRSQRDNPRIKEKTLQYNVPIHETKEELKSRIREHLEEVKTMKKNVWVLTHAIVVSIISREIGQNITYVPYNRPLIIHS